MSQSFYIDDVYGLIQDYPLANDEIPGFSGNLYKLTGNKTNMTQTKEDDIEKW